MCLLYLVHLFFGQSLLCQLYKDLYFSMCIIKPLWYTQETLMAQGSVTKFLLMKLISFTWWVILSINLKTQIFAAFQKSYVMKKTVHPKWILPSNAPTSWLSLCQSRQNLVDTLLSLELFCDPLQKNHIFKNLLLQISEFDNWS